MLGGEPTVITSAEGGRLFPSVVAVNPKTDERMVGQVAKRQAVVNPENTVFSIKRFMGRKFSDAEVQRQRKSSANRVMTNLRAALNYAFEHNKVASDAAWKRVKAFKSADAARLRYLTIAEAKRLINVCEPDFRVLVQAALATGARYSELTRLQVQDFNRDAGTLYIQRSKTERHAVR